MTPDPGPRERWSNSSATELGEPHVAEDLRPATTSWLQLGILCASQLVVWTGFGAVMPFLPLFLQEEAHSSLVMIGFITGAFYLGTLLFSSLFGWLSDILGRKPLLVAGMAVVPVVSFLFTRTLDPTWFLLFRLIEGTSAATGGIMYALVADITTPAQQGRSLGLLMSSMFAGAIAGPALGAAIYSVLGGGLPGFYAIFYFLMAAGALTTIAMALLVHEPAATKRRKAAQTIRKRRPSSRAVLRPAIVAFLIVGFAGNFAFGGLEVTWSILLQDLGASMGMISLLWIALSAPLLLSFATGMLADRYNRFILMSAGYMMVGATYLTMGLASNIRLHLVAALLQGLALALLGPAKQGFLIQASPVEWIGVVQGLDGTAMQVGGLLGTVLFPLMYNRISGHAFAVGGVVCFIALALAWPALARESARLRGLDALKTDALPEIVASER